MGDESWNEGMLTTYLRLILGLKGGLKRGLEPLLLPQLGWKWIISTVTDDTYLSTYLVHGSASRPEG